MYISFNNKNAKCDILLEYNNCTYKIPSEQSLELPVFNSTCRFSVTAEPLTQEELFGDEKPTKFAEKLLHKAAKKLVDSVSGMTLNPQVSYELGCADELTQIDLIFEEWSEFDGDVAMFLLETYPIFRTFCRAESATATLKVVETRNTNLRQFLKTARYGLVFIQFTSIFWGLLFFLPYYIGVKYFASDFHFSKVLKKLYNMKAEQREEAIKRNSEKLGTADNLKGCLVFSAICILAVAVVLIVIELLEKIVGLF